LGGRREQVERVVGFVDFDRIERLIGVGLEILAFGRDVQRLEDARGFQADNVVALRGEIAGVDKALVGQLGERAGAIAGELAVRGLAGTRRRSA
jgi:hypothetical protein